MTPPPPPLLVEYTAPADCPTQSEFEARVRARTELARFADEPNAQTLQVVVRPTGVSYAGHLSIVGRSGRISERDVEDTLCENVVDALALVTAIAVDPAAMLAPSEEPNSTPPPPPSIATAAPEEPPNSPPVPKVPLLAAPDPAGLVHRVDVEYACIFPLMNSEGVPTPRDCSGGLSDPLNSYECDCESLGLPPEAVPSVCGLKNPSAPYAAGTPAGPIQEQPRNPPTVLGNDYITQYFAKTYPTIRELTLANMMGSQGIISSLCPIHTVPSSTTMPDQLYGYRPAINAIVNRLRTPLAVK